MFIFYICLYSHFYNVFLIICAINCNFLYFILFPFSFELCRHTHALARKFLVKFQFSRAFPCGFCLRFVRDLKRVVSSRLASRRFVVLFVFDALFDLLL